MGGGSRRAVALGARCRVVEGTKLTVAEVVRRLGAPERIRADLDDFRQSARAFSSNRPRLIDEYRQRWVAVLDGAVVAHSESFPAIIEQIDARGLPRAKVMVRFIDESPRTMIL